MAIWYARQNFVLTVQYLTSSLQFHCLYYSRNDFLKMYQESCPFLFSKASTGPHDTYNQNSSLSNPQALTDVSIFSPFPSGSMARPLWSS